MGKPPRQPYSPYNMPPFKRILEIVSGGLFFVSGWTFYDAFFSAPQLLVAPFLLALFGLCLGLVSLGIASTLPPKEKEKK